MALAITCPGFAAEPTVANQQLQFELPDLGGALVSSSDSRFSDRVLYITAWATWCPPCLSEIPVLIDLQKRYHDQGLSVVAVAFEREGEDRLTRLREFCEARNVNYLVLNGGPPENFSTALPGVDRVKGLPIEFLVDRSGRVVASRNSRGYSKKWAKRLEREIVELLAEGDR